MMPKGYRKPPSSFCRKGHALTAGNTYLRADTGRLRCKICTNEASKLNSRKFRRDFPEKAKRSTYAYNLKTEFGMTIDTYETMASDQGFRCAICRQPEKQQRRLSVDHNHETGKIRELLCAKCNQGLGLFDDDPERLSAASVYVMAHSTPFHTRRIA